MPRASPCTDPPHIPFFLLTPSPFGRTFAQAVSHDRLPSTSRSASRHAFSVAFTWLMLEPKVNPKGVL
jgi:hypothetical protein